MRYRRTMRRLISFFVSILVLASTGSAAAQGADEWSGTVFYENATIDADQVESSVTITRNPDGSFSLFASVHYITNPGACGQEFFRTYEAVGQLTEAGDAIAFDGTLKGNITSTCSGELVGETDGPASTLLGIDGGTINGHVMVGSIELAGPVVFEQDSTPANPTESSSNGEAGGGEQSADATNNEGGAESSESGALGDSVEAGSVDAGETDDEPGGARAQGTDGEGAEGEGTAGDRVEEESSGEATAEGRGGDGSEDGIDPLVLIGGIAVVGSAGALELRRRKRKRPQPDSEQAQPLQEEEERKPSTVSLELTYPAGYSPFVFQFGWVFGARCVVDGPSGQRDLSDRVKWSGSDAFEFHPAVGRISYPRFLRGGPGRGGLMSKGEKAHGTISLAVDVDGETTEKTFTVGLVSGSGYSTVGDNARCPSDSHGCPACPHAGVIGPITTGSPTVTNDGLPAARVGDKGIHAACCGGNTYTIASGDPSVLIDGRPAAMIGSQTHHCGGHGEIVHGRNGMPQDL